MNYLDQKAALFLRNLSLFLCRNKDIIFKLLYKTELLKSNVLGYLVIVLYLIKQSLFCQTKGTEFRLRSCSLFTQLCPLKWLTFNFIAIMVHACIFLQAFFQVFGFLSACNQHTFMVMVLLLYSLQISFALMDFKSRVFKKLKYTPFWRIGLLIQSKWHPTILVNFIFNYT